LLIIKSTTRFLKDLKLAKKRRQDIAELEDIVDLLQFQKVLPLRNRDHNLSGNWKHHRECHIEPDWLLIYRTDGKFLFLERTGSHADLFE
jgi:mRNA interferase YafQ